MGISVGIPMELATPFRGAFRRQLTMTTGAVCGSKVDNNPFVYPAPAGSLGDHSGRTLDPRGGPRSKVDNQPFVCLLPRAPLGFPRRTLDPRGFPVAYTCAWVCAGVCSCADIPREEADKWVQVYNQSCVYMDACAYAKARSVWLICFFFVSQNVTQTKSLKPIRRRMRITAALVANSAALQGVHHRGARHTECVSGAAGASESGTDTLGSEPWAILE
jgi:hypothetical protein